MSTSPTIIQLFVVALTLQSMLSQTNGNDDNWSLEKKAYQSTLYTDGYGDAVASRAVDGNTNSNFYMKSCTHTLKETSPWWTVDLGTGVHVTTVTITNRGDCSNCGDTGNRLHDFNIGLTDTSPDEVAPSLSPLNYEVCYTYSGIFPPGKTIAVPTSCANRGRYLTIQIPGPNNVLTLCEVAVAGQIASVITTPMTQTSLVATTQSSALAQPRISSNSTDPVLDIVAEEITQNKNTYKVVIILPFGFIGLAVLAVSLVIFGVGAVCLYRYYASERKCLATERIQASKEEFLQPNTPMLVPMAQDPRQGMTSSMFKQEDKMFLILE